MCVCVCVCVCVCTDLKNYPSRLPQDNEKITKSNVNGVFKLTRGQRYYGYALDIIIDMLECKETGLILIKFF